MPRVCSNWMGQGTRNEPPDLLVLPKVKCYVWFSSDGNSCSSLELSLNDTSSGLSWQTLSPLSLFETLCGNTESPFCTLVVADLFLKH